MTTWAIYALVVVAGPLVLIVRWLVASKLRERRRLRLHTQHPENIDSVAAIRARVERERADELAAWPSRDPDATTAEPITGILPITEPDGSPTERAGLPAVDLLDGSRRRGERVTVSRSAWPTPPGGTHPVPTKCLRQDGDSR